jgi:hypothetical protein
MRSISTRSLSMKPIAASRVCQFASASTTMRIAGATLASRRPSVDVPLSQPVVHLLDQQAGCEIRRARALTPLAAPRNRVP